MSRPNIYKVVCSNEHASDELPYEFVDMETAIKAGQDWKAEMVAIDDDPAQAAREYQWEVVRMSTSVVIEFKMDNAIFEYDAVDEVGRLLKKAHVLIFHENPGGALLDSNGNSVGTAKVLVDGEETL